MERRRHTAVAILAHLEREAGRVEDGAQPATHHLPGRLPGRRREAAAPGRLQAGAAFHQCKAARVGFRVGGCEGRGRGQRLKGWRINHVRSSRRQLTQNGWMPDGLMYRGFHANYLDGIAIALATNESLPLAQ